MENENEMETRVIEGITGIIKALRDPSIQMLPTYLHRAIWIPRVRLSSEPITRKELQESCGKPGGKSCKMNEEVSFAHLLNTVSIICPVLLLPDLVLQPFWTLYSCDRGIMEFGL